MAKIMMTKKEFEAMKHPEVKSCCGGGNKKLYTILGFVAVIAIISSAISWNFFIHTKESEDK